MLLVIYYLFLRKEPFAVNLVCKRCGFRGPDVLAMDLHDRVCSGG